jgi:hypothetical protein
MTDWSNLPVGSLIEYRDVLYELDKYGHDAVEKLARLQPVRFDDSDYHFYCDGEPIWIEIWKLEERAVLIWPRTKE